MAFKPATDISSIALVWLPPSIYHTMDSNVKCINYFCGSWERGFLDKNRIFLFFMHKLGKGFGDRVFLFFKFFFELSFFLEFFSFELDFYI